MSKEIQILILLLAVCFAGVIFFMGRAARSYDKIIEADTIKCEEAGGIMTGIFASCKFPPSN